MLKKLLAAAVLALGLAGGVAAPAMAQDYHRDGGWNDRGRDRDNGRYDDRRGDYGRGGYGRGGGLTAYDYVGFDGRRIQISDYEPNLGYDRNRSRFNDRIESIEFRPGQRWLICSDANFRGRCLTIDRPIRDLRRIGMANTISSIRRLN